MSEAKSEGKSEAKGEAKAEMKTYTGGCHCGKVRFEVKTDLAQLMTCNCSICAKTGAILTFVPVAQFTLLSGAEALTDYQFGKKHIHHTFCSTCGIRAFASGASKDGEVKAVNVRSLDDMDLEALKPAHYDGKSL